MENAHYFIYGLVDPRFDDAIRYVGLTSKSLPYRLCGHVKTAGRASSAIAARHVVRWIRSLDAVGLTPGIVMLDSGIWTRAEVADRERYWIQRMRALGADLCNLTDGGDGVSGYQMMTDARSKISSSLRGRQKSPETVARMRAAQLVAQNSPVTKQRQAIARANSTAPARVISLETRKKLSEATRASWERRRRES